MFLFLIPLGLLAALIFDWWTILYAWRLLEGEYGGWDATLGVLLLLVIAFATGVSMLRAAGPAIAANAAKDVYAGKSPARSILNGVLLAAAGLLFILPGFASDAVALVLVLPGIRMIPRAFLRLFARKRGRIHMAGGGASGAGTFHQHTQHSGRTAGPHGGGEWIRVDEADGDDVVDVRKDDYDVK